MKQHGNANHGDIQILWKLISENSFVGALTSGLVLLLIGWLANLCIKKYRAAKLFNILKDGLVEKHATFLPTVYLSSKSGYTQAQVEDLCSHHKQIQRNEKELESWRVR